jgi:hypothetical protein
LELDEEERRMLQKGGLFGSMNDTQFFRDLVGRVVGDEFGHSETGHEFIANLNLEEKKSLMIKIMKSTSQLYDEKVKTI